MMVKLLEDACIRLPQKIVKQLSLNEGDLFDCTVADDIIRLEPIKQAIEISTTKNFCQFSAIANKLL